MDIQPILPIITAVGGIVGTLLSSTLWPRIFRFFQTSAGAARLRRTGQENQVIVLLEKSLERLEAKVSKLEGRIEGLEHEKFLAYQQLATSEAEVRRLTGMLADREEYITQLEQEHAKQAEQIERLTDTISEKYRAGPH